jgi:hypothetical protein
MLFSYGDLLADGMSREHIRLSVDDGALYRVGRGVYATAEANEVTRLRGLFLRMPEGIMLSHQSAAHVLGFGELPADGVHVLVPVGTRRPAIRGVVTHEAILPVPESRMVGGIPCVPAARAAVDLARSSGRLNAIATLDAALRVGACSPDDLAEEVDRHHGLRNVIQARQLVRLADARPECAQESHVRLVLIDGGLPAPEPQVWIIDDQGIGGCRLDLAYREKRVGLEYDGASHLSRDRLRADRQRMNWLASRGWRMRYFTDHDLYRRPFDLVNVVRAALRQ